MENRNVIATKNLSIIIATRNNQQFKTQKGINQMQLISPKNNGNSTKNSNFQNTKVHESNYQDGFLPQIENNINSKQSSISQKRTVELSSSGNQNLKYNQQNFGNKKAGIKNNTQYGLHYKNTLLGNQQKMQLNNRLEVMRDIKETSHDLDEQSYSMIFNDTIIQQQNVPLDIKDSEVKKDLNKQFQSQTQNLIENSVISITNFNIGTPSQDIQNQASIFMKQNNQSSTHYRQRSINDNSVSPTINTNNNQYILSFPLHTDKMVSYQSFSPAQLIKKTKNNGKQQQNSNGQVNLSMKELIHGEKKMPHQVLKQKFVRNKMALSALGQGSNINTKQSPDQNALSQGYLTLNANSKNQFNIQENQAYQQYLRLGQTNNDGFIFIDKVNQSLKSFDTSPKNQLNPVLRINSINPYLKIHGQGTLKQSPSHQVLGQIQVQGDEIIDNFNDTANHLNTQRLQSSNDQQSKDQNECDEEDEEDDQSECLSEKSHDLEELEMQQSNRDQNQTTFFKDRHQEMEQEVNGKFLKIIKIQPQTYFAGLKLTNIKPSSITPQYIKPSQLSKKFSQKQQTTTGRKTFQQCLTSDNMNLEKTELINKLQLKKKEFLQNNLQQFQISFKKRKKKAFMGNVMCTIPKNLKEQELQFFQSNFTVNPIFTYDNYQLTQRYVNDFLFQKDEELLKIAVQIIQAFLAQYGSEKDFIVQEGRLLTREETELYFKNYIGELGLEEHLALNFTHNAIAPTSITHGMNGKKSKINICLPIDYSEGRILGVMHHEIGTHFVRKFNDKFQPWVGKRTIYQLGGSLETEEGLACINQQLENTCYNQSDLKLNLKPFLFRPALYYYCCYQAQTFSFVELFKDLEKFIQDPHRRWKYVMRVKRGLQNSQEPGGFYKDQVYLRGAVDILKNRKNLNFEDLYAGKIALDDVLLISNDIKKIKYNKDKVSIKLPTFLKNIDLYAKAIDEIAEINFIK
eukprot:403338105